MRCEWDGLAIVACFSVDTTMHRHRSSSSGPLNLFLRISFLEYIIVSTKRTNEQTWSWRCETDPSQLAYTHTHMLMACNDSRLIKRKDTRKFIYKFCDSKWQTTESSSRNCRSFDARRMCERIRSFWILFCFPPSRDDHRGESLGTRCLNWNECLSRTRVCRWK